MSLYTPLEISDNTISTLTKAQKKVIDAFNKLDTVLNTITTQLKYLYFNRQYSWFFNGDTDEIPVPACSVVLIRAYGNGSAQIYKNGIPTSFIVGPSTGNGSVTFSNGTVNFNGQQDTMAVVCTGTVQVIVNAVPN